MPNFSSILDMPSSDIQRPKPLPTGTYVCIVHGAPRFDKSPKTQTDFVEFTFQPTEALDDVDAEALEAMGGFESKQIKSTYWLTDDAAWRLKKFLEDCGIEGETLRRGIDQAPGQTVLVEVVHVPSKDGQSIYANVGGTAKYGE